MGDAAAEAENADAKFVHFCWVPKLRWDGLFEGISFAHSHPPSLAGSEGRSDPILQSCKIGTASRSGKTLEEPSATSVVFAMNYKVYSFHRYREKQQLGGEELLEYVLCCRRREYGSHL